MYKNNAKLFVVSAPSGCGKGTVLGEVFKSRKVYYSVSYTTRKARNGEVDGVNYFFTDEKHFAEMVENDEFFEHACFVDHSYGTPKKPVMDNLENGTDVILEIETQGAFQVKKAFPQAVLVFIVPPTLATIRHRLEKRGTEEKAVIDKRCAEAAGEIAKAVKYDYVIVNDALEDAVRDFNTVVDSVKLDDGGADKFSTADENTIKIINEVLNYDA